MPYEIGWYVDQQVIFARYWGVQTEDELIAAVQQTSDMIEASPYTHVHRINDVSNLDVPLPLVKTLKIIRDADLSHRPGWSIIVGERNAVMRFIIAGVRLIVGQTMRSVATFDEAIVFLQKVDPEIRWPTVENG